jgi:hypothetical protein
VLPAGCVNPLYGEKLKANRCGLDGIVPGVRVALGGVLEGNNPAAHSSELALLFCLPLLLDLPPAQASVGLVEDRLKPLGLI